MTVDWLFLPLVDLRAMKAYPLVLAHKLIDLYRASRESYTASGGRQSSGKVAVAMALVVVVFVW